MLFQNTIDHIDTEVTELLAQVEDLKRHQSQLIELDALTLSTLEGLADVVGKVGHYAPDAERFLKVRCSGIVRWQRRQRERRRESTRASPRLTP